jgi:RNA recognition motif-containing protein
MSVTSQHTLDSAHHHPNINIFVGNLTWATSKAELTQVFMPFGQVLSVHIMDDTYIGSRRHNAYGFVQMARSQGEAAIKGLNGTTLKDQIINTIEALPLTPPKETPAGISHLRNSKYRQRVQD